ncbi:MAG: hypothetical protein K0U93_02290, partial [Gammaproteobacteria bacterium]|nr:hypothetical protein [Gammaproteobacteria bacterium]
PTNGSDEALSHPGRFSHRRIRQSLRQGKHEATYCAPSAPTCPGYWKTREVLAAAPRGAATSLRLATSERH